jgi:Zn-dependent protease with chaperone function
MMSLVPAGVLGLVAGVVVAVTVSPLVGIGVLVVVAAVGSVWTWQRAPASLIRAIGAVPSMEADRPRLHNLVDGLCATMGLPTPAILVVESEHLNAMAVGRTTRSASLIVTSGLDRTLSLVELEGVVAHELVHVKRRDTVLAGVAVAVAVPVSFTVGTEAGADLVHRLVGRGREFAADQRAATVVRYPPGLAAALRLMIAADVPPGPWPIGNGRRAAMTRWLWIDPGTGSAQAARPEGVLDDASVRADALSLL